MNTGTICADCLTGIYLVKWWAIGILYYLIFVLIYAFIIWYGIKKLGFSKYVKIILCVILAVFLIYISVRYQGIIYFLRLRWIGILG